MDRGVNPDLGLAILRVVLGVVFILWYLLVR